MSSESSPAPPAATKPASNLRSRISLLLLLAVAAFIAYGAYERFQLAAIQKTEKLAFEQIRSLHGMTVDGGKEDWRVIFAPDQPGLAKRISGVYIPHEGQGDDYTQKVIQVLKPLSLCEELNISSGPVSNAMGGPGPRRKLILKPGEKPPVLLDIAAIRKEFPHLKVTGEEYLVPTEYEYAKPPEDESKKSEP